MTSLTTLLKINQLKDKIVDAAGMPLVKRGKIAMEIVTIALDIIESQQKQIDGMEQQSRNQAQAIVNLQRQNQIENQTTEDLAG